MRIKANELDRYLTPKHPPVFLITGDEPLQVLECADQVRQFAKKSGFSEREVFNVDASFDWDFFLESSQTLSLFASRKLLDVRLPTGKLKDAASQAVSVYMQSPSPDNILLITAPKLDKETFRAGWFTAIEKTGVVVQVWPIDAEALPVWIMRRVRAKNFTIDPEAAQFLAENVEGNLLAAAQEIDKLCLNTDTHIKFEHVAEAVANNAQFDVYSLVDAGLSTNQARVQRVLNGLRETGTEPLQILWALSRELRILSACAYTKARGGSISTVFDQEYVLAKHQPLIQKALGNKDVEHWCRLLKHAARIDRTVKGMEPGNVWDELLKLCLGINGARLFQVEA